MGGGTTKGGQSYEIFGLGGFDISRSLDMDIGLKRRCEVWIYQSRDKLYR